NARNSGRSDQRHPQQLARCWLEAKHRIARISGFARETRACPRPISASHQHASGQEKRGLAMACSSVIRRRRTTPALGAFASIVLVAIPTPAFANPESARRVLQGMSDYLASQPNLSADLEIDLDVITPQVEKIQFSATGRFLLSRPGRV